MSLRLVTSNFTFLNRDLKIWGLQIRQGGYAVFPIHWPNSRFQGSCSCCSISVLFVCKATGQLVQTIKIQEVSDSFT